MDKKLKELYSKRDSFLLGADVYGIMLEHEEGKITDEELLEDLKIYAPVSFPLPTGRYGSILAVALESHKFIIAELLYDNAKKIGLNLNKTISPIDGTEVWSLGEEVAFADATWNIFTDYGHNINDIYNPQFNNDKDVLYIRRSMKAIDRLYKKTKAPTEYRNMKFDSGFIEKLNLENENLFNSLCLVEVMSQFDSDSMSKELFYTRIDGDNSYNYALPNGRRGNILALALNMNLYKSAKFIFNHDKNLSNDVVSYNSNESDPHTIIDELLDSILTYSPEDLSKKIETVKKRLIGYDIKTYLKNVIEETESLEYIITQCGINPDNKNVVEEFKTKRDAYIASAAAIGYIEQYEEGNLSDEEFFLKIGMFAIGIYALPSGRYGNLLALALETNNFISADFICENYDVLNLDKVDIITNIDNNKKWTLAEEIAFADIIWDINYAADSNDELDYLYSDNLIEKDIPKHMDLNQCKILSKQLSSLENLYEQCPSAGKIYKKVEEHEISKGDYNKIKSTFRTCMETVYKLTKCDSNDLSDQELLSSIQPNFEYPLPSGKIGNIIALALELNLYISSRLIIDNEKALDLNLQKVAYDKKTSNQIFDIKDEIVESLKIYDPSKMLELAEHLESMSRVEESIKCKNTVVAQNQAIEDICKKLGITNDKPNMGSK